MLQRPGKGRKAETGTLGKALDVIEAVAASDSPQRFKDLLEKVDQPRGTLHRQISNLVSEGLLTLRADHFYELGPRLLHLASRAWAGNSFRQIAEPHLAALHQKTGETVHLGILQGTGVIYLDKVESRQTVRMHSQIGNSSPCYCTGVGKAALSALAPDETERRIGAINFRRYTPSTIAGAGELLAEIEAIRREGTAYDREEHERGIHCVAAPLYNADRSVVGGLSVTAPSYRIPMSLLEEWAPMVRQSAAGIMDDMRIKLGPRA